MFLNLRRSDSTIRLLAFEQWVGSKVDVLFWLTAADRSWLSVFTIGCRARIRIEREKTTCNYSCPVAQALIAICSVV